MCQLETVYTLCRFLDMTIVEGWASAGFSRLLPHPDKEQEAMRFEQQVALVTGAAPPHFLSTEEHAHILPARSEHTSKGNRRFGSRAVV